MAQKKIPLLVYYLAQIINQTKLVKKFHVTTQVNEYKKCKLQDFFKRSLNALYMLVLHLFHKNVRIRPQVKISSYYLCVFVEMYRKKTGS